MRKIFNLIGATLFFILCLFSSAFSEETLTITTYYPSPYGSYNQLYVSDKLGIGTTTPDDVLNLDNVGDQKGIHIEGTNAGDIRLWLEQNTVDGYVFLDQDDSNNLTIQSASKLKFNSNGATTNMVLDAGGNVGIGTTGPGALFHLSSGSPALRITDSNAAADAGTWHITGSTANTLRIQALDDAGSGGGDLIDIKRSGNAITSMDFLNDAVVQNSISTSGNSYFTSGNLGIGTTSPGSYRLYLAGGEAYCDQTTCWNEASDITMKTNIMALSYGLAEVLRLKPVRFTSKSSKSKVNEGIGLIAQDVEAIVPEVVSGKEGNKGIAYGSLTPIIINAIKELKLKSDALEAKNAQLETRIKRLEAKLR